MSIESALQRVASIEQTLANPATLVNASAAVSGGTAAPAAPAAASGATTTAAPSPTFAAALTQAGVAPPVNSMTSTAPAGRLLAAAESQIGQTEQPPGSNESPSIAMYRTATAGAIPGAPWCAYFASWAARQGGEPLGANGEGLGSVASIWSWAQSTGRAIANGPGVLPKPGDLIVFGDEHVGIVRGVLPNGNIQTIEGNYENKVALNERPPGEATGYVEMS